MNRLLVILLFFLLLLPVGVMGKRSVSHGKRVLVEKTVVKDAEEGEAHRTGEATDGGYWCRSVVEGRDTLLSVQLPTVWVFPPMKFKSKKQEKFYWRTVRDVKKTLPYAKIVGELLVETNDTLMKMGRDRDRKRYMKQMEKNLFAKYEKEMRTWTLSQGKMLIKLISRETDQTSYALIKSYRGGFVASFWQSFAKLCGADLKDEYGDSDKDKIVERVIVLVEAGQL